LEQNVAFSAKVVPSQLLGFQTHTEIKVLWFLLPTILLQAYTFVADFWDQLYYRVKNNLH